jgi:hypothetical protein
MAPLSRLVKVNYKICLENHRGKNFSFSLKEMRICYDCGKRPSGVEINIVRTKISIVWDHISNSQFDKTLHFPFFFG